MRQDVSKSTQSNLKKKFQISFRRWIKNKSGGGTIAKFVGGNIDTVRKYVSDQFIDGMNWSNYGEKWVLDHIVPLRLFDMTKDSECMVGFHYKNTIPLFKEDNLYKEGDLRFSMLILKQVEPCCITEKLNVILTKEIKTLDKYLK